MTPTSRRLRLTASGVTRQVDVTRTGQVSVEGVHEPVVVNRIDHTTFLAVVNGRRIHVDFVKGDHAWRAFAEGFSCVVDVDTPVRRRRASPTRAAELSAPMPATIVTVLVEPGQVVERGDVLVVLEAMKMELTLRAPNDGTVDTVTCKEGELAQPGVALVTMQSADGRRV